MTPPPAVTALKTFLTRHRIPPGDKTPHTHLGLAGFWKGKYAIPASQLDTFLRHYIEAIRSGERLTLAETHGEIGPLVIDIDLRYPLADSYDRRYTAETVQRVVTLYRNAIHKFLDVPTEHACVYVFEKSAPVRSSGYVKDGIHMMFPGIRTTPWVQFAVRDSVLADYELNPLFPGTANPTTDIFDAAVIKRNAWMLVGSSKTTESMPYELTHVWNEHGLEMPHPSLDQLVRDCTLRGHTVESVTYWPHIDSANIQQTYEGNASAPTQEHYNDPALQICQTSTDVEYAKQIAGILHPWRFDDYASWIDVGLCLYNVSDSLCDFWDRLSQQSPKYAPGECEKKWLTFQHKGLGIGTLCMWAKQDNPELYNEIRGASEIGHIERALSNTNRDVARLVHFQFRREYLCSSEKSRTWYHFEQHRWVKSAGGSILRLHMMDVLSDRVREVTDEMHARAQAEPDNKDLEEKVKAYDRLHRSLGTRSFCDDCISVVGTRFYDPFFNEKRDAKPHLVGFINGVLDLRTMEFRNGDPEDYITLSTHRQYRPWREFVEERDPRCAEILRFLDEILPDPAIRDYVMHLLASCMYGANIEQKVHIWTGGGGNGKSKLIELFELAMGDYAGRLPTSVLTQKRGSSSAASPEMARMCGKRFASLHEPESGDRIYVGVMKELSGGDKILARGLYEDAFEFVPMFKMVLLCNKLPVIPSSDCGVWRRLRVVEFGTRFVDREPQRPNEKRIDPSLNARIRTWAEPFMGLLCEYFQRYWEYVKRGQSFPEPDHVTSHTRNYQKRSDMVWNFLDERFTFTGQETHTISVSDMFYQFRTWYAENYNGSPMNQLDFKAELAKHGIEPVQGMIRGIMYKRVGDDSSAPDADMF